MRTYQEQSMPHDRTGEKIALQDIFREKIQLPEILLRRFVLLNFFICSSDITFL